MDSEDFYAKYGNANTWDCITRIEEKSEDQKKCFFGSLKNHTKIIKDLESRLRRSEDIERTILKEFDFDYKGHHEADILCINEK